MLHDNQQPLILSLDSLIAHFFQTTDINLLTEIAIVIISKLEEEAVKEFEHEQDPQNKLVILGDCIRKIQQIQLRLVACVPAVDSPLLPELKWPAGDFAHITNQDNKNIGHILDNLASKAFKLATTIDSAIISSEDIVEQIFKPIFAISKEFKIGSEENHIYINKIKEKISNIENTEKLHKTVQQHNIEVISEEEADELFKYPQRCLTNKASNKMVVYNSDHTVSYLIIKTQGIIKKFYVRNEQQYAVFNQYIVKTLKHAKKDQVSQPSQEIIDVFDSLVGINLKYPESQCKIAYNELSGFRRFYRPKQEELIGKIKLFLEEFNNSRKKPGQKQQEQQKKLAYLNLPRQEQEQSEEDFNKKICLLIEEQIIPEIKRLLTLPRSKFIKMPQPHLFFKNIRQVLSNYLSYRSVSRLARNYELIQEFAAKTLPQWEEHLASYKANIKQLLDAIRPKQKNFGYHTGFMAYLANYNLEPENCEKYPTIVYDPYNSNKIQYLIIHNGEVAVKILPAELARSTRDLFNNCIKQNLAPKPSTISQIFLNYNSKLARALINITKLPHQWALKNLIYAPTKTEQLLKTDIKHAPAGSIKKISFINSENKFLIIKGSDGEIHIINHKGGNRLYKPQDVLPMNKTMPTALFLLGMGHFADVKIGFLPSGAQKVIKVIRQGSTNSQIKRDSYSEVWDQEIEGGIEKELNGLTQNKKLIAYGSTPSYLHKTTKKKQKLLHTTQEKLAKLETSSRSSTSSHQEEQQLTFMAGQAIHIVMELSGTKDLRDEIAQNQQNTNLGLMDKLSYCLNRAIECCDILQTQHKQGTHNDFKPANIAVTRDGSLEIIDFGTYQQGGISEPGKDLNAMLHGTPAFISPDALLKITAELTNKPITTNLLCTNPVMPDKPYTPNNLKQYYIKRRLHDILSDQNINITNITDLQTVIKIILDSNSSKPTLAVKLVDPPKLKPRTVTSAVKLVDKPKIKPNLIKNSNYLNMLQRSRQSKEEYSFKIGNQQISKRQKITWKAKDEIIALLKMVETNIKARSTAEEFVMGCDRSYDMYSLIATISGSANQNAYLTNIIFRYGFLSDQDLPNLLADSNNIKSICRIENYLGEGQGLQLDQLFAAVTNSSDLDLTVEKKQAFSRLQQKWEHFRNQILLQQGSYKQLTPEDGKKILQEIRATLLDISVVEQHKACSVAIKEESIENSPEINNMQQCYNFLVDNLEAILNSYSKSSLLYIKKLLTQQSLINNQPIKFITNLCYFNYPNNLSAAILRLATANIGPLEQAAPIVVFYRLLVHTVCVNEATINKDRKLVAAILLASVPNSYDVKLLSKEIVNNLDVNDIKTIELIKNTVDKQLNILDTLLSCENISVFQEDFIDIEPRLWAKDIDNASCFFSEEQYEKNMLILLQNDKVELFKKLLASLSAEQIKQLQPELVWAYSAASKFNSKKIVNYLKKQGISKKEALLDQQAILEFITKKAIKNVVDNLAADAKINCIAREVKDKLKRLSSRKTISYVKSARIANNKRRVSAKEHKKPLDIASVCCSKKDLETLYEKTTSAKFYELIDDNDPLKAMVAKFVFPASAQDFDLSLYDQDTLNTLIKTAEQLKDTIPSKPSLIKGLINQLNAVKQKKGAEILVAYNQKLQTTKDHKENDYSRKYAKASDDFKAAKLNLNYLIIKKQHGTEAYNQACNVFKQAKLNLNYLIITRKTTT